jgi:hypothetical protein
MYVYPAVVHDPRSAGVMERLHTAYSANHPASDPPNGEPPFRQTPPPSPGFVVGGIVVGTAGLVIGAYYALEAIAAYCGDVHPASGESAEVNC